ncbi:type II CRISPR RNA-guided endonuclease Cas9 [Lentisphaerota bacterium ZTH]|nr:type II CRISPR RNA-guided endonuclease Cas9 [Lentisphaerota bacterium]WET07125.1 type II CRISPR RNA-guided endonuclease Cas9 [Lentisphaerota bacterium ZTH]
MSEEIILGLDLGTNSLGWALLKTNTGGRPAGIIASGSRIFQAGMEDAESPKPVSRAANRRDKRLIRRQLARRRRRLEKLRNLLKNNDLLPEGEDMNSIIRLLDAQVTEELTGEKPADLPSKKLLPHILPYYLRARALDKPLHRHILGRIIYHLAQRRGFLSNRRNQNKNEDDGVVKEGIAELRVKMKTTGARTLGEYFAGTDPAETRIRGLWTSRDMYEDEFEKICTAQSQTITKELKEQLYKAIFFQRKMKPQKNLIGNCQFEPAQKRCPWYRDEAQVFRICQGLNNLRLIEPSGLYRELNGNEWQILFEALEGLNGKLDKKGNLTVAKAKKLLGLSAKYKFSIEAGGERVINGHQVNARLHRVFEDGLLEMSVEDRESLVHDISSIEKDKTLVKRGMEFWGLSKEKARALAELSLPEDYCNLSSMAICRLLPDMLEGIAFQTAVKKHYPDYFKCDEIYDRLPLLDEAMGDMRNPAISRTLTQMRKVVNRIISEHGLPDVVRIEVARDLKRSNKEKQRLVKAMRDNQKSRDETKQKIFEEAGIESPSRDDVTRVMLAEECNWKCPYTGKGISMNALLGESQFDIEHIIPFSRSLDNSFGNKTLCWHHENRHVKKNMTPHEAYVGDQQKYGNIITAVKGFNGKYAKRKLELFELQDTAELEDFSNRHLNDTRYISKAAMKYLGMLYGGINDIGGRKRIQALSGGVTALVRRAFGMNHILGSGEKTRNDHRHHALDAVAIAMTSPAMVKQISDLAGKMEKESFHYQWKERFKEPISIKGWEDFRSELQQAIDNITVSHYVPCRVRGALHEETIYSRNIDGVDHKGKEGAFKHVRKSLAAMNMKEVESIVDLAIRKAVIAKLTELGTSNPAKAFADPDNLPVLRDRKGKAVNTIKAVKFRRMQKTVTIGEGDRARNILPGSNHHMEIVESLDKKGNLKWDGYVVSLLEAGRRLKNSEPVVKRDFGVGREFKFSLTCGDIIELEQEPGVRELFIIRTIPQSRQLSYVRLTDSRKVTDIKKAKEWYSSMPNTLVEKKCRKMTVTPLGKVRRAND